MKTASPRDSPTAFRAGEIAAQLGVSAATAIRWTQRTGLVSRRSRRLTAQTRASIEQIASGASAEEAAARFGVSRRTASRIADAASRRREVQRAELFARARRRDSLREAAAAAGVGVSTAIRWARAASLPRDAQPSRLPTRGEAVAAMERGMSAAEAAATFALDEAAMARLREPSAP